MNKQLYYRTLLLISIIVIAVLAITLSGCGASGEQDSDGMSLSEYLEETDENWFLTGKNEYTVQAMMVSEETTFHNDLEVVDLVATEDGGPDLSDVWVLNGLIFPDCYDTSHMNEE